MDNSSVQPKVINLGPGGTVVPPTPAAPRNNWFSPKKLFLFGAVFVLVAGLGIGTYLATRPKSQSPQSQAATGKSGCNNTCSGDPPGCSGNTCDVNSGSNTYENCGKNNCSSVTISGMPSTMNAWGIVNPTYNQPVTCVVRSGGTKADCTCQTTPGVPYCWLGLVTLVKNVGVQGHRWAQYVYNKTTNQLIAGGPTSWVLYDDNNTSVSRWGNSYFFGASSAISCGERKEYREQADPYSPGSWVETGQVIYAEATGPGCGSPTPTPTVTPTVTPTPTPTVTPTMTPTITPPPGTAACQNVTSNPLDLSKVKINDTITFIGYGVTSAETEVIDKINFIVFRDGTVVSDSEESAVRDTSKDITFSGKAWKGTKSYKVIDPGSYSVRIRVHWQNQNVWKE